ncbi:MAG: exo-alpha-sialidase, partial [Dehalococcoidia bacterium]|nr:exo-alpha-sialidase [Dehalococcoidia bacterium]
MTEVLLMIGTRKGAFTLRSSQGRQKWELDGPVMGGQDVNWMTFDRQTGRMYALFNDAWFGPQVQYSTDLGKTWASCATSPRFKNDPKEVSDQAPWVFQENKVLERLWALEPGGRPGELYCAVAPATMFKSSDGGDSWEELESLTNHRTRERWEPGAGGLMVHSMVVDPDNPDRITIAISAAGVFQTDDGGKTWEPRNVNIRDVAAQMDPNVEKYPEAGQCVHHLVPTPRKGR